jgi:hypothetical protein
MHIYQVQIDISLGGLGRHADEIENALHFLLKLNSGQALIHAGLYRKSALARPLFHLKASLWQQYTAMLKHSIIKQVRVDHFD